MKKQINLLPPDQQRVNRLVQITDHIANFGAWLILSLGVLILVLFIAQIFIRIELDSAQQLVDIQSQEINVLERQVLEEDIQVINQDLVNFRTLNNAHERWSAILLEFARMLPADLTLDSLVIDRQDKKVEVKGRGATRDSVLVLRENLLASSFFTNVNFPLANLEKATNVEWSYRFSVNPQKLK